MKVLVIDIGGSHVKLLATGAKKSRKFESGEDLTPSQMVERAKHQAAAWDYDVIALGVPATVAHGRIEREPGNLGPGWVGFDFEKAFGRPVRLVNDAAMQALGGYDGGRMLFLGLGTGLGSALVSERVIVPLELGDLPTPTGEALWERVGKAGCKRIGKKAWQQAVKQMVKTLRRVFIADYVVLGGGNAKKVDPLPRHSRRGGNDDAFAGGFRLWEEMVEPHDRDPSPHWRVVR